VDSSIVGYAITTYNYWTLYAARALHLNNLFVLPEYRSQGVGKAIFFHLCKVALDRDLAEIKFEVINWDIQAIGFYESLCAKRTDNFLHYSLDGENLEQLVNFRSLTTL
jgi:ribosomal protein S18 acetylase RimI-like enzyme